MIPLFQCTHIQKTHEMENIMMEQSASFFFALRSFVYLSVFEFKGDLLVLLTLTLYCVFICLSLSPFSFSFAVDCFFLSLSLSCSRYNIYLVLIWYV